MGQLTIDLGAGMEDDIVAMRFAFGGEIGGKLDQVTVKLRRSAPNFGLDDIAVTVIDAALLSREALC